MIICKTVKFSLGIIFLLSLASSSVKAMDDFYTGDLSSFDSGDLDDFFIENPDDESDDSSTSDPAEHLPESPPPQAPVQVTTESMTLAVAPPLPPLPETMLGVPISPIGIAGVSQERSDDSPPGDNDESSQSAASALIALAIEVRSPMALSQASEQGSSAEPDKKMVHVQKKRRSESRMLTAQGQPLKGKKRGAISDHDVSDAEWVLLKNNFDDSLTSQHTRSAARQHFNIVLLAVLQGRTIGAICAKKQLPPRPAEEFVRNFTHKILDALALLFDTRDRDLVWPKKPKAILAELLAQVPGHPFAEKLGIQAGLPLTASTSSATRERAAVPADEEGVMDAQVVDHERDVVAAPSASRAEVFSQTDLTDAEWHRIELGFPRVTQERDARSKINTILAKIHFGASLQTPPEKISGVPKGARKAFLSPSRTQRFVYRDGGKEGLRDVLQLLRGLEGSAGCHRGRGWPAENNILKLVGFFGNGDVVGAAPFDPHPGQEIFDHVLQPRELAVAVRTIGVQTEMVPVAVAAMGPLVQHPSALEQLMAYESDEDLLVQEDVAGLAQLAEHESDDDDEDEASSAFGAAAPGDDMSASASRVRRRKPSAQPRFDQDACRVAAASDLSEEEWVEIWKIVQHDVAVKNLLNSFRLILNSCLYHIYHQVPLKRVCQSVQALSNKISGRTLESYMQKKASLRPVLKSAFALLQKGVDGVFAGRSLSRDCVILRSLYRQAEDQEDVE